MAISHIKKEICFCKDEVLFGNPFPAYVAAPPQHQALTELEALYVLALLIQHKGFEKPPSLVAFQKLIKMECELDALLY